MSMGDVFATIAIAITIVLTSWATTLTLALLCPNPVARAEKATQNPRGILLGGLLLLFVGFFGIVSLGNPFPLVKLVALVVLLAVLALASFGLAGICQAASRRIMDLDPATAPYPALVRGSACVVGATLLPILGWLLYGPLLLIASLGAGWKALVVLPGRREAHEAI